MKDHLVTIPMDYRQKYKLPRCRKFESVFLTEKVTVAIREIEPGAAPVAYRIYADDRYCDARLHKVRWHDGSLWWPLTGHDGPITVPKFLELAADGEVSSLLRFDPSAEYGIRTHLSYAEFFADLRVREMGECDRDERIAKTSTGAARVAFCDGLVFINGGIPVWYVIFDVGTSRLEFWLGHAAWDVEDTRDFWTAGPDWRTRRACYRGSRVCGLDELDTEMKHLGQFHGLHFRSRIDTVEGHWHPPEAAALLCLHEQITDVWRRATHGSLLRMCIPLLAAARDVKVMPKDIDARRVLAQLSSAREEALIRLYAYPIAAARGTLRRLEALGCGLLDGDDEAALAALGS